MGIAEEEKELIENEKTDEPEKTEEVKEEEEKTEPKKVHLLQKLFGKRKDFVVPKIDEVAKTDKEIINDEEKTEKTEEKVEEEKEEKAEKEKVQHKFKKLFSMKKAKKEEKEEEKVEEKIEEGEEKKDEEKKDEEEKKDNEKKEGEEAIEEASEVDVSTTTAEKKTLMQKLMTIKRDLMANKKEEKVEEEKKEENVEAEKKEGEEEVKAEGEETKDEEAKDELGNEKPKPSNRIKKFFSMKRQRKTTETEEKPEEEKKEEEEKPEEAEKKEDGEVVKEEEVVEQIIETILRIQLQNRTPTIPCLSAMQLKLESWLKFHGIKYENVQEKENLPASALLPMQSNDYLTTLATKEEKMVMPMELDAEQKNIHFAILSWQCSNIENTLKGYNINLQTYLNSKAPLALLKLFFKNNFCKSGLKMVKSNGFSQSTTEEIEQLAKNDLKVLAEMLGE